MKIIRKFVSERWLYIPTLRHKILRKRYAFLENENVRNFQQVQETA